MAVSSDRLLAITEMKQPASKEEYIRDQASVGLGRVFGKISTSIFAEISFFASVAERQGGKAVDPRSRRCLDERKEIAAGAPVLAYYRQRAPTFVHRTALLSD